MKKLLFCFCFTFFFGIAFAQDFTEGRYRITFKDKNNSPFSIENPQDFLSQKAIDRRTKFNIEITEQDIPVSPQYISVVSDFGGIFCNSSKWFNSAIFNIDTELAYNEIKKLSFVKSVEYVAPTIVYKANTQELKQDSTQITGNDIQTFFSEKTAQELFNIYGSSLTQNSMLKTIQSHYHGHVGQNMTIAVVDAGFLHVDSAKVFQRLWKDNRILFTRDITGTKTFCDSSNIFETGSHGMMVLSLIGGFYPTKLIGTAPGANFILIRSEEEETEYVVEEDNWIAAAELADSAGADIISTSLGYNKFDDSTQSHTYSQMDGNSVRISIGADIAASKGMLLVNSAGNSGDEPWKYITSPADADSIITVGAIKRNKKKTNFSSIGPTSNGKIKPDVVALGLYPTIVIANGDIKNASGGTSFSCPLVAGCCATLWEEFPDSSAQAIKKILLRSSDNYDKPNCKYGYGEPNIAKACAYCYAKELYDILAINYTMPDFDIFFEKLFNKNFRFSDDFMIEIKQYPYEEKTFIIKKHNYEELKEYFNSQEYTYPPHEMLFYTSYKKSVKFKVYAKFF